MNSMTHEEIKKLSNHQLHYELQKVLYGEVTKIVDYCQNLDALQAIEATLTPKRWELYIEELEHSHLTEEQTKMINYFRSNDNRREVYFALSLSARQRVEALLLTLYATSSAVHEEER
jgi:hypothetical protein